MRRTLFTFSVKCRVVRSSYRDLNRTQILIRNCVSRYQFMVKNCFGSQSNKIDNRDPSIYQTNFQSAWFQTAKPMPSVNISDIAAFIMPAGGEFESLKEARRLAVALGVRGADYYAAEMRLQSGLGTLLEIYARVLHCWLCKQQETGCEASVGSLHNKLKASKCNSLAESIIESPYTLVTTIVYNPDEPNDRDYAKILHEETLKAGSSAFILVEAVVEIMLDNFDLVQNWRELVLKFCLNATFYEDPTAYLMSGSESIRWVFAYIVGSWVTGKGDSASLTSFCSELRELNYSTTADKLEECFGESVVLTVSDNQYEEFKLLDHMMGKATKYMLHNYLGYAAFGIVFSALRFCQLKPIAIKILCPRGVDDQADMIRESRVMSRSKNFHCNLVKVLRSTCTNGEDVIKQIQSGGLIPKTSDFILSHVLTKITDASRLVCIEMELCGKPLRCWTAMTEMEQTMSIKTTYPFPLKWTLFSRATNIASDIFAGLKFLHTREILHRDLKPENIYISAGLEFSLPVKIGDFGQCREVPTTNTMTQSHQKPFSYIYRAPEARTTTRGLDTMRYGKSADWFSVGLILYELFYSIPKKDLDMAFNVLRHGRKMTYPPRFPHLSISGKLKDVIMSLTREKSKYRTKIIDLLCNLNDLQTFLLNTPGLHNSKRTIGKMSTDVETGDSNPPDTE